MQAHTLADTPAKTPSTPTSDEPVLGFAGVELAASAGGLELGPFELEALACEAPLVLVVQLADSASGRGDTGRGDRFEEGGGDRLVDAPAAERFVAAARVGPASRARAGR